MVLSHRKLKQKRREENAKNPPNTTPQSLSDMLEPLLQENVMKGEKRVRDDVGSDYNADLGVDNGGFVDNNKKKKRRKKKKENKEDDVGGGGEIINQEKVLSLGNNSNNKEKKKKKKKVKKFKKKKKKGGNEEKIFNDGIGFDLLNVDGFSERSGGDTRKVYVGGMPYYSTDDDIRSYFDHCGTITDIDCMTFPETGKFRGIAILTFETEEAAKSALALDGSEMAGLYLKIQPYKATRSAKASHFSPPVVEGYNRIYAGNLSWDITEDDLRKLFSDCNISSIRFGEDKETGEFKGYAHVDFSDDVSLNKALKLDQTFLCGRPVKISRAVPKKGATGNSGSNSMVDKSRNSVGAKSVVTPENIGADYSVVMPERKSETNSVAVPAVPTAPSAPPVPAAPVNSTGVSSGKLKRRTCYECGERGHISSDCPKKPGIDQQNPTAS